MAHRAGASRLRSGVLSGERELGRALRRADQRAAQTPAASAATDFEQLVADVVAGLPDRLRAALGCTRVLLSDRGRELAAYAHHHGDIVDLPGAATTIVLYEDTLEDDFGHDRALLARWIGHTLSDELERVLEAD